LLLLLVLNGVEFCTMYCFLPKIGRMLVAVVNGAKNMFLLCISFGAAWRLIVVD